MPYIVKNKKRITYTIEKGKVIFSDGKIAIPDTDNIDVAVAWDLADDAPIVVTPPVVVPNPQPTPVFASVGSGSGFLDLGVIKDAKLKIKAGTYDGLNIKSAVSCIIDATDVLIKKGGLNIDSFDGLELFGLAFVDAEYRAININNLSNNIHLHHVSFKNVSNYTIRYGNQTLFDGTEATKSKNWKLDSLTFDNTGQAFNAAGGVEPDGTRNLMSNFTFTNSTIKNCPGIGDCVYIGAVENYNFSGNTIDNVNTANNEHNGLFHVIGNGVANNNKATNHQGNLVRAWGISFGKNVANITLSGNTAYNSRKYGALELQCPPYLDKIIKDNPGKYNYTNAKVFNNTGGQLNTNNDWDGQMLDLYYTGGTTEYYNNLGFDMKRFTGSAAVKDGITNMINLGNDKLIDKGGNKYFQTQAQAVTDTKTLRSLHTGIGAQ